MLVVRQQCSCLFDCDRWRDDSQARHGCEQVIAHQPRQFASIVRKGAAGKNELSRMRPKGQSHHHDDGSGSNDSYHSIRTIGLELKAAEHGAHRCREAFASSL